MTKAPWNFSTPVDPAKAVPNAPTPQGEELGRELARLTRKELERESRQFPHSHVNPCDDCAFVEGTFPNRCPATLMDAIKCVVEAVPFHCHKGVADGAEPKKLCAGWRVMAGARERLACAVSQVGSRDALMSKRCDHGSVFEWAPVAQSWRIDRREGCRCWWPEPPCPYDGGDA